MCMEEKIRIITKEETIKTKIREILNKSIDLAVSIDIINDNDRLVDFGMDSMGFIRVITCIEEEFQIEFEVETMLVSNFETINHFFDYIKKMLEGNQGSTFYRI